MVLTEERNGQEWRDDRSVGSSTNPFDEDYIDQQEQNQPNIHRKSSANVEPLVTTKNPFDDTPTTAASGPKESVPSVIGATTGATSRRVQGARKQQEQESTGQTERRSTNETSKASTNPFDAVRRSDSYDSSGSSDRTVDSLDSAPMVTPSPPSKKKASSSSSFRTSTTSLTNLSDVENRLLNRLNRQYDEQERPRRIRRCDVPPLRQEYDTMRKHLRAFTQAARKYKDATKHMAKSQIQMAQKLAHLAQSSPLAEAVGSSTPCDMEDNATHDSVPPPTVSQLLYTKAHSTLDRTDAFDAHVIQYCCDWDRCIARRLDAELKILRKCADRLDHYHDKVERLRKNDKHDKLKRNETKWGSAWTQHESQAIRVCYMLEEVTIQGWQELMPLLQSLVHWTTDTSTSATATATPIVHAHLQTLYAEAAAAPRPHEYDAHLDAVMMQAGGGGERMVYGEQYDDTSTISSHGIMGGGLATMMMSPLNTYREDHMGTSPKGIADVERL